MTAFLIPMYDVARERLSEAVAEFPAGEQRSDFLGGEPWELDREQLFAALRRRWQYEEREHCEHRPVRWVPQTRLALIDQQRVVGQVDVRHRLTSGLRRLGGHVGYVVVPSMRRRGYGRRALELALPVARGIGVATVLVTCHHANEPSRRILESVGAVLVDRCGDRLRFVVRPDGRAPTRDLDALR